MNKSIVRRLFMSGLCIFSSALVYADSAPVSASKGPLGGGLIGIAPWILIFVVFYFLLIRPQQKQAQEHKKMLEALKKGDRVLTQGGLYGTISAVKGKALEVKLTDEVKVMMSKSSVSQLVSGDPAQENEPSAAAAPKG